MLQVLDFVPTRTEKDDSVHYFMSITIPLDCLAKLGERTAPLLLLLLWSMVAGTKASSWGKMRGLQGVLCVLL